MSEAFRTLKAEIESDLGTIADIYLALDRYAGRLDSEEGKIVTAYYLHNLYNAFENIFRRVASAFGNEISEKSGWHADLLRRMGLEIPGIRPALISEASYDCLDELCRFRHIFRSAYRLELDPDRLALVYKKAQTLRHLYMEEMNRFLRFLESLIAL